MTSPDKGHSITAQQRREIERAVAQAKGGRFLAAIEAELSAAKGELQAWEDKLDRYTGNNPNKFRTDIRLTKNKVARLEAELASRQRGGA